jgi:hypothetical protein
LGSQTPGGAFGGNIWTDGAALPACPADVVATPPGTAGCYTASWVALQPSRTYNYRVNAYNEAGPSGPDLPVAATTLGPPNAPSGLTGTAVSATQVNLAWLDNSGNETGFRVQRSTDGVNFTQIGPDLAANTTIFSDTTTVAGTTYIYRVVSFNANGVSAPSNSVIVITPAQISAPGNLVATPSVLSDQPPTVRLNWTDNSTNEGGFAIERALGAGAFAEIARVSANVTTFLDTTVGPKLTYSYRVRAFLGTAFSNYSNVATATTPGEIPEAPSNLRVTRTSNTKIDLAWNDNSPNETNFLLQRATNAGFTAGLTSFTIGANATTFSDKTVARRTTYFYRIRAANADGSSAFSNTVSATTR